MFVVSERTKLKVKLFDQEMDVLKPTLGQVEEMQQELSSAGDSEKLGCIKTFLCKLGLTGESISQLEMDQLTDLLEYLTGSKKK